MRLTFLGTGTSFGVPVVGCDCETCRSTDPRDRRSRHAALLQEGARALLIDTPPELRLQLIDAGVDRVDAVWYTHCHADHVHGVDDLRALTARTGGSMPVYAAEPCAAELRSRFGYVFDPGMRPQPGTSRPDAVLHAYRGFETVEIAGFPMQALPVPHGEADVYGFRVGALGYVTDAKMLPDQTYAALEGVRVLVLNALWFGRPHPTHFNVEEAVEVALRLGAERTFLTHLSHRLRHADLAERLPPGIAPAYDGLTIEF
jgi:phosphoribosyl 1,2-cyclic phosphate phosphodiesterase